MGNPLLFLLLLPLFLYETLSMACTDVPTQVKCVQLNGCSWSTSCTGTFTPTCVPPSCYYIDSYTSNATTETGQIDNPIKTISGGINKLANTTGTLIVLNYVANQSGLFNQTHVFSAGALTIQPLFYDSTWFFNITGIPIPASNQIFYFFRPGPAASVTVYNATFNYTFNYNQYCFDLQGGNLTLNNFYIYDSYGNKGVFFRITNANPNSVFIHNGGVYSNSTLKYTNNGNMTFKNVNFTDLSSGSVVTTTSSTTIFDGCTLTGGTSTAGVALYTGAQSAIAIVKNCFIVNTGTIPFTSATSKSIIIQNTRFVNVTSYKTTILYFSGVSTDLTGSVLIEDTSFINCVVPSSVIAVEKNGISLTMNRVKMYNITKSTLVSEDAQYASEWVGGLCALSRNDAMINITNSNFTNIYSHCIGIKASVLNINGSKFNNTGLPVPTLKSSMSSSLNDKSGISWINIQDVSSMWSNSSLINITGNSFLSNNLVALYGGAVRVLGVMSFKISFINNVFTGNTAYYGGAIYSTNKLVGFSFNGNTFSQNSAYDGGALYKKSSQFTGKVYTPSIIMNGDHFSGNSAIRNGGAAVTDWESFCMQGVTFTQNTAQNGGGMYIINLDEYFTDLAGCFSGNQFIDNSATNVGGALKLFFDYSEFNEDATSPTVFQGNTANKGNDVSSEKPSYYMFSFYNVLVEHTFSEFDDLSEWVTNSTRTSFAFSINTSDASEDLNAKKIIQKSGNELTQIIMLEILNEQGALVNYINNEYISVQIGGYVNSLTSTVPFVAASPVLFPFTNGVIYMKNTIQIIGEPRTTANLSLTGLKSTSNLLLDANLILSFNIPMYFQDCEIGDIFDTSTRTCETCASGTYSLADPYSESAACIQCDKSQANCLGGAKIAVLPGYWRYSSTSDTIFECPAGSACLGGLVNDVYYAEGICASEYEGNLCDKCIPNYAKFGSSDTCENCRKDSSYYLKLVGFFALRVIAVVYSVKVNLSKVTSAKKARSSNNMELSKKLKNEDFQSNLMKIMVNFLQVSSLIVQYKFEWPNFIVKVWDVTNKFVPTDTDGFSIDCIVALITQDNRYLQFIKLVVTLFEPFGLWIALVMGYMVILKIKKEKIKGNPKVKKNAIVLFVITSFIIQPSIVQATLQLFKCENLRDPGNPTYFMVEDPQIQCWTALHITWSVGIALPFFLLWGIILPALLFKKIKSADKDLQDTEVYSRYAFVYVGLKSKRYYWEFVNLIRKTLLIIIFVFLNMISVQTQAFATFLVILVFGVLHVKYRPYNDKRLNRLELLSLLTLGIMIYSGMFFLSGGSTSFTTILLIIIAFIFNLVFYAVTGLYFIKSYRSAAKKFTRSVTKKIRGSLDKVVSRSDSNNSSLSSDKKENSIIDANQIGEMLSEINVQLNLNQPDIASPKSVSDASRVPSEEDSSQVDKKTVYAERKEEANYSIMKNSGYYNPPLSLQNSGYNLPGLQSGHNSTVGLLSPAGSNRQFSFLNADRFLRPLNSMDASREHDNIDTPGTPPRNKSRFRVEYEDSPRRNLNLSASPNLKMDDLLVLKNSPSSPRKSKEEMEGDEGK